MTAAAAVHVSFEPRGEARDFFNSRDPEVVISGPFGCVAGETQIYDPLTGKSPKIIDLWSRRIAPTVQTLWGPARATVPFLKGNAPLYRITLESGYSFLGTAEHRVLTPDGWLPISACSSGSLILSSSSCHPACDSAPCLSASPLNARRSIHRPPDFLAHCCQDHRLNDEQPLSGQASVQVSSPSRADVPERIHDDYKMDGRAEKLKHIPSYQQAARPSMRDCSTQPCKTSGTQSHVSPETPSRFDASLQYGDPSQPNTRLLPPTPQVDVGLSNRRSSFSCHSPVSRDASGCSSPCCRQCQEYGTPLSHSDLTHTTPESLAAALALDAYNLSRLHLLKSYYTAHWDRIATIRYERTDYYFDLHVPNAEHYLAEGIWHHNTGKTRPCLEKIHLCLSKVAGARALIVRKTNTSLTGAALETYRKEVLRPQDGVVWYGGSSSKPPGFIYPNGSFLAVGGMDNADRVLSTQYDLIYYNEVTEGSLNDWETLGGRLRNNVMPFQQLIGDCNPSAPTHWIKQRAETKRLILFKTTHRDNPVYFDSGVWTRQGIEYMKRLDDMTGVRRLRYRDGIWAAAEGQVYENFDRELHVIDRFPIPKTWARYRSIDFGYTNPFVCQWWAVDEDGRMYMYREIYLSNITVALHARRISQLSVGERIISSVADHDAENRAELNAQGIKTVKAKKKIQAGIQAVEERLKKAGDGKPRMFFLRDSLDQVDQKIKGENRPFYTDQEFDSYVWQTGLDGKPVKEEPLGVDDHGMDATRYAAMHLQAAKGAVVPFALTRPSTWRNA